LASSSARAVGEAEVELVVAEFVVGHGFAAVAEEIEDLVLEGAAGR
jgi:hypothetical protein